MTIRVRFAPSPTGHLHVGNARTALFNWLFARKHQGALVLRIEDTDLSRSEGRFEDLIYNDLKWLGMDWDEGPDCGGEYAPYRQSERTSLYREKALQLIASGKAYYCFCAESELDAQAAEAKAAGLTWRYPGTCRDLPRQTAENRIRRGESAVIRLKVRSGPIHFEDLVHGPTEFSSEVISDLVLIRSNGLPTYNYAVVIDDALMEISHVIRGDDHLSNTPKQVLIYEAFGWKLPSFAHLSTILGSDHSRLSKRHGATSVQNFQEMGILPEALMNYIALLGWAPPDGESEIQPPEVVAHNFDLEKVSRSPAVFDTQKLYWINRHYLKACAPQRLISLAVPFLQQAGWLAEVDEPIHAWIGRFVEAVLPRIDHLSQIVEVAELLCEFSFKRVEDLLELRELLKTPGAVKVVRELCRELSDPTRDVASSWKDIVATVKSRTGQRGKDLFHPIRIALTRATSGPELDKLVPLFEEGSRLPLRRKVKNCRERACEAARVLGERVNT
jgi:glutamyl-tRNA synthetase/nondiscriminating glutamyl-tRNA synthetase